MPVRSRSGRPEALRPSTLGFPRMRLLHTTFSSCPNLPEKSKNGCAMLDCDVKHRPTDPSLALIGDPQAAVDSIRNIGFTDTQVYCTTGTRKIRFRCCPNAALRDGCCGV